MEKKSVTVISLVLMLMIMFMFEVGSAFAYHPTVEVNTVNGQTVLKLLSRNGIRISINVAKNGTIVERYRRIVKQTKDGKGYYMNYWHKGLAMVNVTMIPNKNKLLFSVLKRFGDVSDGVIYSHHRSKKVKIFVIKMFQNNHVKLGGSFTSPKVQDLTFKFNYPQPKLSNSYSRLTSVTKIPGKNQKLIGFQAVDGLRYVLMANLNNKFSQLFIIKNVKHPAKSAISLFSIRLTPRITSVVLIHPDKHDKPATSPFFFFKNNNSPKIYVVKYKKVSIYYNFKNFK